MYKLSTLKRRPKMVTKLNLGEWPHTVVVSINNEYELLELTQMTTRVWVAVDMNYGEELLSKFLRVVWTSRAIEPAADIWFLLDPISRDKVLSKTRNLDVLWEAYEKGDGKTRVSVARNTHLPRALLELLVKDDDDDVRLSVYRRRDFPSDRVLKAFFQEDRAACQALSWRVSEDFLRKLSREQILGLLDKGDTLLRSLVYRHLPGLDEEIIARALEEDPQALLHNARVPVEALKTLVEHQDPFVRAFANARLRKTLGLS